MDCEAIDALCIGEGDQVIVEVAGAIDKGEDCSGLENIWLRSGNGIIKNDVRALIEDLDVLPFPDRDIYFEKYSVLRKNPTATFILGRGCPYRCSYCFNHLMRGIYSGKGKFVRFPSVDYAIAQIKDVKNRYGFKWVQINDDTINVNKKWFTDFLLKYEKEIKTPFICNIRADAMDEELADLMVFAGVNRVNFGVESGNERMRKEVLNRHMANEQLIRVGRMFNKRKVRVFTANMIGLPGETVSEAFETIKINKEIKPELAAFDVLQPFPKTDIYKYCIENNLLKEHSSMDDFSGFNCGGWGAKKDTGSVLNQENVRDLINLQKFTALLVRHYWLKPVVKQLIRMRPNRIFDFINGFAQMGYKIRYASSFEEKFMHVKDLFGVLAKRRSK